ncbi:hypothetical protein GN244_ATG14905 [Phytophthora infestans]|uniref:Uncharacterized protein n=1 Tax=Phytophthora infestans TaxID=4787 RepID=A0A833SMT5_PHYIN|nr:hypothetical protein GN244_ATG14905 [Phytophthora infestans]
MYVEVPVEGPTFASSENLRIWCRRRRGHSLPTRFPSTSNYTYLYAHMGWHFRCLDRGKRVEYGRLSKTISHPGAKMGKGLSTKSRCSTLDDGVRATQSRLSRAKLADPKDTTNTPWSGQATRKAPSGLEVPLKRGKANGHYNDQKSRV